MLMPWAEAVSLPKAQRLIVTREVFYVLFVVCKSMLAGEGGCRCRGHRDMGIMGEGPWTEGKGEEARVRGLQARGCGRGHGWGRGARGKGRGLRSTPLHPTTHLALSIMDPTHFLMTYSLKQKRFSSRVIVRFLYKLPLYKKPCDYQSHTECVLLIISKCRPVI